MVLASLLDSESAVMVLVEPEGKCSVPKEPLGPDDVLHGTAVSCWWLLLQTSIAVLPVLLGCHRLC